jgi:hypothetical protein
MHRCKVGLNSLIYFVLTDFVFLSNVGSLMPANPSYMLLQKEVIYQYQYANPIEIEVTNLFGMPYNNSFVVLQVSSSPTLGAFTTTKGMENVNHKITLKLTSCVAIVQGDFETVNGTSEFTSFSVSC